MEEICNRLDCVGCGACLSACNNGAITMQPDSLGFLYPVIDKNRCVDCGLCVKSCLNNNRPVYKKPTETFVGCAVDAREQLSSTSGGLASVFMRVVLQSGGVVYGCSGEDARNVRHIRIDKLSDIALLKGSKYVQSYMGTTYKSVVTDLRGGGSVLFIGTPCQVAGLRAYLRGKRYDNLYTVDFVCHGVPSQRILNDAIDIECKGYDKLGLVNRVKENGKESKYTLRLVGDDKIVFDEAYPSMGYITGFLSGLFYRENCYRCQFTRRERVSDVTLGDFWDRNDDVKGLTNKNGGLSMIMVNTEMGKNLIEMCDSTITVIPWSYEDFIRRNGQLKQPLARHAKRDEFEGLYNTKGYEVALKRTLRYDSRKIRKNLILNSAVAFVSKAPMLKRIYKLYKNR